MYLLDTNVWLERLLAQAKSDEVGKFLDRVPSNELFLTDFAFHSICIILLRLKKETALRDFVQDLFVDGEVTTISLTPDETLHLLDEMNNFSLDFDDAYQYVAAEKYGLVLVSFDSDLDRTALGKKTPGEILATL